MTFDLPFCIYLDDGLYEVSRGDWTAVVQVQRVDQTHLDPRLGIQQSTSELIRDRHGWLRFSKVVVEMPAITIITEGIRRRVVAGEIDTDNGYVTLTLKQDDLNDYHPAALEEALRAVNRLIEVYRQVTDSFYVKRVLMDEIFQADTVWYEGDEPIVGTHYGSFGHGITIAPASVTPEILATLRSRLMSDGEIPISFELFQDSRDRLDRGEYRLAVMDARTALEVWVDKALLGFFEASNISLESGCQILGVQIARTENLADALQQASINRKLGHALNEALGIDLHNGYPELWTKWLNAKTLREQGAHQGEEIDRAEAIEAVNSMGEIMGIVSEGLRAAPWLHDQAENNNQDS